MAKSTKSAHSSKSKPEKPYRDFPLFPHATGRWAKKIRGKFHYFGSWDNPQAALERLNRDWPYLSQGLTPPPAGIEEGCTLKLLCDAFMTSKKRAMLAGELSPRTFREYYGVCRRLVGHFGRFRRVDDLRPDDFERYRSILARRLGVVGLRNEINTCRVVFKYAHDQGLVNRRVNYGQSFNRPNAKAIRRNRYEAGLKMFEAHELRTILDVLAGKQVRTSNREPGTGTVQKVKMKPRLALRSMVLLGVNCGFGNSDCATLPQAAVDLGSGWINFPRPKTVIPRRVPLWPETVKALRAALKVRPEPVNPADSGLCFLTRAGAPYVRVQTKKVEPGEEVPQQPELIPVDAISPRFAKLLEKLGINGRRGLGFYTLRHVFETVGGESKDQVAVNAIMGHVDSSMAVLYRESISDERLKAVVNVVRNWLWPAEETNEAGVQKG